MKARGLNLVLGLACVWVLWTNAYSNIGWQADDEYKTLSECKAASAKAGLRLIELYNAESEVLQEMGFFERLLSSRKTNLGWRYKCLPTGVGP